MKNKSNYELRGISQAERSIIDAMTRLGKSIIHAENLEAQFGYTRTRANLLLSRLTKKGWLQRLAPGTYRIIPLGSDSSNPIPDDPWAIAMEIFDPCYLSGWTAAEHWDLTEQIFNSTLVFTSQKQRKTEHKIAGLNFRSKVISSNRFFGINNIWSNNVRIQMADLDKTIVDIMDDPEIGGGGLHSVEIFKAYSRKKEANLEMLYKYAETLNHGAVFKRLGFLIEKIIPTQDHWIGKLNLKIKSGIIALDPNGPDKGPIVTKWGIRINVPLKDVA